jgi:Phytanoyl-CoA dioxygenase (PhyH)
MLEQFRRDGFVVVPRLLEPAEVEEWTVRLETVSGLRRQDFALRTAVGQSRRGLVGAWTMPDGVSRTRDFWPLVLHDRLVSAARELLGPGACFLQHTDLHVGFSAPGWRRDSVNRRFREGRDWDETREPYRIVRAGVYLQGPHDSSSRLGVVPGTHRTGPVTAERRELESATGWWGRVRGVFSEDPMESSALWLKVASGDCVLFDPRLLHSGTPFDGPKYSFFLTYGVPNGHFHRHRAYYRHRRADLRYRDLDPELVTLLQAAGLHASELPPGSAEGPAAFRPSRLETLARGLRFVKARR